MFRFDRGAESINQSGKSLPAGGNVSMPDAAIRFKRREKADRMQLADSSHAPQASLQ
jgi:hypothetical protein